MGHETTLASLADSRSSFYLICNISTCPSPFGIWFGQILHPKLPQKNWSSHPIPTWHSLLATASARQPELSSQSSPSNIIRWQAAVDVQSMLRRRRRAAPWEASCWETWHHGDVKEEKSKGHGNVIEMWIDEKKNLYMYIYIYQLIRINSN